MSATIPTNIPHRARAAIWFAWLALLLPTLVAAGIFVQTQSVLIAKSMDERTGVGYVGSVDAVLWEANEYRATLPRGARTRALATQIDVDLAALERFDSALPARLRLGADLGAIVRDWHALRAESSPPEAQISAWIDRFVVAISTISDRSSITYDPGNDTINLGDALAIQYSKASERFARLAGIIAHIPSSGAPLPQRFLIARLNSEALDRERIGVSDISEAMTVTPALVSSLATQSARIDRDSKAYAERVDAAFVRRSSTQAGTLASAAPRLLGEHRALKAHLADLLDGALATRIAYERKLRAVAFAAAFLFAIASSAVVATLVRSLVLGAQLERVKAEHARERELGAVQRELSKAEEKFRVTFDQTPVGIMIVDDDLSTVHANPALEALVPDARAVLAADGALFERALATGESVRFERRYRRRDEEFAWAEVVLRGVSSGPDGPRFVLGTFRDVTESKALATRLVYDATHDALTGLPNRSYFENALAEALERSACDCPERWALLFLDLDDFKLVNDSVGHHAGDAVLVATAQRLRRTLDHGAVICRLAGDEFAILLPLDEYDAGSERAAANIVAALKEPVIYEASSLAVGASIGIVALGRGTLQIEDALRAADTAMYQAKSLGGGRYIVFDASLHARTKRRKQLTADLRLAIDTGTIDVAYQPIVDLRSGRVRGFEALARWSHPTEGSISPAEFVPIAEESGTIERLGALVLLAACEQLRRWRDADALARDLTMSINVAARQILNGSIVHDVVRALGASGVPAKRIVVEITESVLIDHVGQANVTLAALRRLGVGINIDDFGTGYSSLQYLQRFPVDGIKIDRSFVSNGAPALASEPIVQMLVTLSRVLDLYAVVEGIETQTQLQRLISLGCTTGQGHLFAPALAADGAWSYAAQSLRMSAAG